MPISILNIVLAGLALFIYLNLVGIIQPSEVKQKERIAYINKGFAGKIIRIGLLLVIAILIINALMPIIQPQ